MSLSQRAHPDDEELAMDRPSRPAVEPWQASRQVQARPIEPHPLETRPVEVISARRGFDPVGFLSSIVGLAFKLVGLLILLTVLWALAGFVGIGSSVTGGVGAHVSSAIEQGAAAATAIGQRAADEFDPAHPPRAALTQDLEIDELLRLNVGAEVPGASTRAVTLAAIQRRPDAPNADAALYATLHSELRQPNDTKVLGVTIRSTTDPHDDYLYKGETVRIGAKLYKVNWISAERQQIALVLYRDQDHASAAMKAAFD
jgi:hypothetical protein